MRPYTFKPEELTVAKIVQAINVSPEEAHDLLLDCGPKAHEALNNVVRALHRADDVGYLILKIRND